MGRPSRYPKFTEAFIDRYGRSRFYLRRPGQKRVPLPGLPWSEPFMQAYHAAMADEPIRPPIGTSRSPPGSIASVVTCYLTSAAFAELAPATRADRRRFLDRFREQHGKMPLALLEPRHARAMLERLTAHQQKQWLKTIRGLLRYAIAHGDIETDPTAALRPARAKDTGGFTVWRDEHLAQFRVHWPIGTQQRLALELMLGLAARRGDAVGLGWQHVREGEIRYRQSKTGVELTVPIPPGLQAALDATPRDRLTFLIDGLGKPYQPKHFGIVFTAWGRAAGLPAGLSPHGLRKSACHGLADDGCTAFEIMAISGHKTLSEVQRYTRGADQKQLARSARAKQAKTGT